VPTVFVATRCKDREPEVADNKMVLMEELWFIYVIQVIYVMYVI
jgi:hypothetical protein